MYLELIARVSTLIILFVLLCNCTLMKCQPKLTVQLHLVYKHVMSHIDLGYCIMPHVCLAVAHLERRKLWY